MHDAKAITLMPWRSHWRPGNHIFPSAWAGKLNVHTTAIGFVGQAACERFWQFPTSGRNVITGACTWNSLGQTQGKMWPYSFHVRMTKYKMKYSLISKLKVLSLYLWNGFHFIAKTFNIDYRLKTFDNKIKQAGAELCQAQRCLVGYEIRFEQNYLSQNEFY